MSGTKRGFGKHYPQTMAVVSNYGDYRKKEFLWCRKTFVLWDYAKIKFFNPVLCYWPAFPSGFVPDATKTPP